MKIILSRKGLDSTSGGFPSPILPDGRLCWIPIPGGWPEDYDYSELNRHNLNIGNLVEELSNGKVLSDELCHLDPDLEKQYVKRHKGWRGVFGQSSVAQSHLDASVVGIGDIFLFFGWFRQAEQTYNGWRFTRSSPDLHVLFGWLQIGEMYHLQSEWQIVPRYGRYHTHFINRDEYVGEFSNNTIYIAAEKLTIAGTQYQLPGFGQFEKYTKQQCLTSPLYGKRGLWELPKWFYPGNGKKPLTYHGDMKRWEKKEKTVLLQTVGRGQEFILDCVDYPEACKWVLSLFRSEQ